MLASGTGTLLQAILDARTANGYDIVGVAADVDCPAVDRAQAAGVPTAVVAFNPDDRAGWSSQLADVVAAWNPDVVVSAGFMRILSPTFIDRFDTIINTHPALLPSFPGAHAVRDALAYGVKVSGSTIHIMDAGVDSGPIIAQQPVPVESGDDEATLHERIKVVERELIVGVLADLARRHTSAATTSPTTSNEVNENKEHFHE